MRISDWSSDVCSSDLFRRARDFRPPVDAYFIGYSNGDFFMVRCLRPEGHRRLIGVGEEVHYVIQSIDREGGEARGLILHLDAQGAVLRQITPPDYPHSFDPRTPPWYLKHMQPARVARPAQNRSASPRERKR